MNIELLTERVLQNAVWNCEHNEVSWYTVQFFNGGSKSWSICPMNMYLYDGLAGMLLLMYSLKRKDKREEIADIYKNLKKRLFRYTDSGMGKQKVDDIGVVAWCYGAPGILYSRMKCYKYVKDQKWKERLGKDVRRAYKKLREDRVLNDYCR